MADQQQSWATTCGGAPPELNVRRLQVGDRFVQTADLRVATERCFLADGRGMRADKRVGGSRGKLYRCDGAVFDVKCKAKETRGCQAFVHVGNPRRKNGRSQRPLMNIRYALGVPKMQAQELCRLRLPNSSTRIQV